MGHPRIYSKNYVSEDCSFASSYYSAITMLPAYDRNPLTQSVTTGANSDSTAVTLTIIFYEGTATATRTLDGVWLLNHNFKDWSLEYYDGSWHSIASSTTDTTTNSFTELASVSASQIRLTSTKTQVAHQEKRFGELIAAGLQLNLGVGLFNYEQRYREKVRDVILGDGSLHRVISRYGADGTVSQKFEANISLRYVPQATRDSLRTIKEENAPMIWLSDPTEAPYEVHEVLWTNPWSEKYSTLYKTSGFDIPMTLRAI